MKRNYLPGAKIRVEGIVPVSKGGTNADNAPEARTNLGLIAASRIGQAEGPIPIDPQTGTVDPIYLVGLSTSSVDVAGPDALEIESDGQYFITNFDSRVNYTVSADFGTVSIVKDQIFYTAPYLHTVAAGFYVNGIFMAIRMIPIDRTPNQASITLPATNVVQNTTSIAFAVTNWSSNFPEDAYALTDWEFSLAADFTVPLPVGITVVEQPTAASVSNIPPGTKIYARVRHQGYYGYFSPWSEVRTFERPVEQKPQKPGILFPSMDGVTHDATTIVVSSAFSGTAPGDTHLNARWQTSLTSDFAVLVSNELKVAGMTSYSITPARDTAIYVRVQYTGTAGWTSEWSATRTLMYVPIEPPERPTITVPATNTVITVSSTTLEGSVFAPVAPGDAHESSTWQRATDAAFTTNLVESVENPANKSSWAVTDLVAGTTYYFRARYKGTSGWWSNWSLVRTIVYGAVSKPYWLAPANGSISNPVTPTLVSSPFAVVGLSSTFASATWEVSTNPAFVFETLAYSGTNASTDITLPPLALGTTYFARVKHTDNNGVSSAWSNSLEFKTRLSEYAYLEIAQLTVVNSNLLLSMNTTGTRFNVSGPTSAKLYVNNPAGPDVEATLNTSHGAPASNGYGYSVIDATGVNTYQAFICSPVGPSGAVGHGNGEYIVRKYQNNVLQLTETRDPKAAIGVYNATTASYLGEVNYLYLSGGVLKVDTSGYLEDTGSVEDPKPFNVPFSTASSYNLDLTLVADKLAQASIGYNRCCYDADTVITSEFVAGSYGIWVHVTGKTKTLIRETSALIPPKHLACSKDGKIVIYYDATLNKVILLM